MRSKSVFPVLAAAFSVLLPLSATPALSQQKAIGLATHIENQVSGIISGQQRTLTPGQEADIVDGGYWYAPPAPGADIAIVAMGAVTPEAIAPRIAR